MVWERKRRPIAYDNTFFDEGNLDRSYLKIYLQENPSAANEIMEKSLFQMGCLTSGCNFKCYSAREYESHYATVHRNVCSTCHSNFPTSRLLSIHISERHGAFFKVLAEKQPMFECLVEGCNQKFMKPKQRQHHLHSVHKYPENFTFGIHSSNNNKSKKTNNKSQKKVQTKEINSSKESKNPQFSVHRESIENGESDDEEVEMKELPMIVNNSNSNNGSDNKTESSSNTTMNDENILTPLNETLKQTSISSPQENLISSSSSFIYNQRRVPENICFGRGAEVMFRNKSQYHSNKKSNSNSQSNIMKQDTIDDISVKKEENPKKKREKKKKNEKKNEIE